MDVGANLVSPMSASEQAGQGDHKDRPYEVDSFVRQGHRNAAGRDFYDAISGRRRKPPAVT